MISILAKIRENVDDLNEVEFLSLIGTTIDEYCAKNGLDTNKIWDGVYEAHKGVNGELGEVDYLC